MTTAVSDSYVSTVEEADAILFFSSTWLATASATKITCLQQAAIAIDVLPLRGERYESEYIYNGSQKDINLDGLTQTLEFPRYIDGVLCDFDQGTNLPIVPQAVKNACCYEALGFLEYHSSPSTTKRQNLISQGVKSFSIGDLSESYGTGSVAASFGLKSQEAYRMLRKYIECNPAVV